MRTTAISLICLILIVSCKTVETPDIIRSQSIIDYNTPLIKLNETLIANWMGVKPLQYDWSLQVRLAALNEILDRQVQKSIKDIIIRLFKSPKVISEKTSFLGIEIENYADIDTGNIDIDIKKLVLGGNGDTLTLNAMASGAGTISLSARYYGIPAGASPDIEASIDEIIRFKVTVANGKDILLSPLPTKMKLKLKFYVDFLAWKLPWSEEIELNAEDMLKPLKLSLSDISTISLPVPSQPGSKENKKLESKVILRNFKVNIENDIMELMSDILIENIK